MHRAFVQSCLRATLANVLSYPFDTVCVRMQAGIFADKSVLHCIKSIYEEQGVGGFYQVPAHLAPWLVLLTD